MCLNPTTIRNPTKSIYKHGGQPLLLDVPCGHCAECKKNKRKEWRFRTYYEVESTVKNGGYVYFDTLTYAPEHVPMLSHFVDLDSINDTIREYSLTKNIEPTFIVDNIVIIKHKHNNKLLFSIILILVTYFFRYLLFQFLF